MPEVKQSWFNRDKTNYETPDNIFNPLNEKYHFTLDVAADNENHKCDNYYSQEDDGLNKDWGINICWMNPPFGRGLKKWVAKAHSESLKGATVVCLIPVRTNTNWWHDYCLQADVEFIKGEVTFKGYDRGLWMPFAIVVFSPKELEEAQKQ